MGLKQRYEKYWIPVYIVPLILFSAAVAFFDAHAYSMFQQLENPAKVYNTIVGDYMQLFHGLVFTGVLASALIVTYYRDLRDGLAYLLFSLAVVWSGIWDLIYYQLPMTPSMPSTLTHLQGTPVGTAAQLFNQGTVTPEMVAVNSVLFLGFGLPLAAMIRYSEWFDWIPGLSW